MEEGLSSLSDIYSAPPLDVAYRLTGAVCCTSEWPATPFSFSHAGAANNLDAATEGVSNG